MAKVDWDSTEYTEGRAGDFEPLAKGRYLARIESIERKDTKRKDGYYFEIEAGVAAGEHKGRKLWARLNVSNPSEIAQRIGREQWNALCVACGYDVGSVKDTKELLGKRCVLLVDIERGQDDVLRNKVTGFLVADAKDIAAAKNAPAKPPAKNAPTKPTKQKGGDVDSDDDDIPF